ncbi:MAG TPA: hypothetical protein VJI96_01720 [Candidatus Andersenbacteria bacterium]|nr:hypothetical protein [Candidatus Andersenbacteria bacterium]
MDIAIKNNLSEINRLKLHRMIQHILQLLELNVDKDILIYFPDTIDESAESEIKLHRDEITPLAWKVWELTGDAIQVNPYPPENMDNPEDETLQKKRLLRGTEILVQNPDKLKKLAEELQPHNNKKRDHEESIVTQPLTWNSKDGALCWGNRGCHKIPRTSTAITLFLDVMLSTSSAGTATNTQLSSEYDIYCIKKRQELEKQHKNIPAYLAKKYSVMKQLDFGKVVHRCVNELRILFDVRPDGFFPIENKSTIENATWVWHNIGTISEKT